MERNAKFYWTLFQSTFCLSAFTVGGGFVIVPLMKKKFVDELGWINEDEMLDITAISQSSPGAIAVNASILIGYRLAGIRGALVTILGTILPPLILLSVISVFYEAFRDNAFFNALMTGMRAGVAAVIVDVVMKMSLGVVRGKDPVAIITMAAAFIAAYFLGINVILIILICGVVGYVNYIVRKKQAEKKEAVK
ncbi:MAG TPA: chromate transporter [Candidatus Merdivicinus excrementipullorum]|uniref:Chromate transporter n=1 Tax=Candidatus Merdivicinus excrementipullorum TaxID=2840867 RepID=A0A9D1FPG5_9FIRM|nr:chromate transporter [Candidatus Merdivicinus excrementipullorum]